MSYRGGETKKTFDLGKYIIVKLRKARLTFEMIAEPDKAWDAKKKLQITTEKKGNESEKITPEQIVKNPDVSLPDIFPTYTVFTSAKKAESPTEAELMEAFNTTEKEIIAANFILNGEFAWTKTQRDQWLESKKKQIITILSRNSINPQTKKPHPPQRIEKAIEEAHVSIDLNKTAEEQIEEILKKLTAVIPIRMETIQMAVKVPSTYAPKAFNIVEKLAQIKQSEWQNDGSWIGAVSLPAGLQAEFLDKLNNLTHGKVQTKLLQ